MSVLDELISDAMSLAGSDEFAHRGLRWVTDGGRACPLDWSDCSQPVFYNVKHDCHDYGEPGGPGAAHCAANCPHHGQPAPVFEDDAPEFEEIEEPA